jgi:hypothetical protein
MKLRLRPYWLLPAAVLVVMLFGINTALALPSSATAAVRAIPAAASIAGFHVTGNRIIDPAGKVFIVKGIDAVYGHFDGGDVAGFGATNFANAARDLDNIKAAGYNLVRVSVSGDNANNGYIGSLPQYMADLDSVVAKVNARGMVAEISNGDNATFASVNGFMKVLAIRYSGKPYVWIKTDDEPNCSDGNSAYCYDWATWQSQQTSYVQTLRTNGYTGPIVVNCISWSWDCSQILNYPLGDSQVVYGAHRFGAGATAWTSSNSADANAKWANLSARVPIIVDSVGATNGTYSPMSWSRGFLTYVSTWVNTRQGAGAIAFVDSWSDSNRMIGSTGTWNSWGSTFKSY